MAGLDATHDPELKSWVESANDPASDFPIQNLPFGVFRRTGTKEKPRGGVASGDHVFDRNRANGRQDLQMVSGFRCSCYGQFAVFVERTLVANWSQYDRRRPFGAEELDTHVNLPGIHKAA